MKRIPLSRQRTTKGLLSELYAFVREKRIPLSTQRTTKVLLGELCASVGEKRIRWKSTIELI